MSLFWSRSASGMNGLGTQQKQLAYARRWPCPSKTCSGGWPVVLHTHTHTHTQTDAHAYAHARASAHTHKHTQKKLRALTECIGVAAAAREVVEKCEAPLLAAVGVKCSGESTPSLYTECGSPHVSGTCKHSHGGCFIWGQSRHMSVVTRCEESWTSTVGSWHVHTCVPDGSFVWRQGCAPHARAAYRGLRWHAAQLHLQLCASLQGRGPMLPMTVFSRCSALVTCCRWQALQPSKSK
jgi:hypothetical protein